MLEEVEQNFMEDTFGASVSWDIGDKSRDDVAGRSAEVEVFEVPT